MPQLVVGNDVSSSSMSTRQGDYFIGLQSSIAGCVDISWSQYWDTTITLSSEQTCFFSLPPSFPDSAIGSGLNGTTLPTIRLQSPIPLAVDVFANLTNRQVTFNRVNLNLCRKIPAEAYSVKAPNDFGESYKYTDVHSSSYNKELLADSLIVPTLAHYAKKYFKHHSLFAQYYSYNNQAKATLRIDSLQQKGQLIAGVDSGFVVLGDTAVLNRFNRSSFSGCEPFYLDYSITKRPTRLFAIEEGFFGQNAVDYIKPLNDGDSVRLDPNIPFRPSLWYTDTPITAATPTYRNAPASMHFDKQQGNQLILWAANHSSWVQNQYWEQVLPQAHADTRFLVPVLNQYDSVMVAVVFWEDRTELFLDGRSLGLFDADSVARIHLTQAAEIRASRPIQIQASTFSDTNRLEENPFGNTIDNSFHGNWASSGFRPDAPKDFITHSIFKPFPSRDTAQAAFVNLTCRSIEISKMSINGQVLNPSLFERYPAAPDFSFVELPLDFDSNYIAHNPGGFLGIHYTKPTVTGAFVPTYALTLTETPFVEEKVFGGFLFKKPTDTTWQQADTLVVCPQTPLQLRLPQYRFTTWQVNVGNRNDTFIEVGGAESGPLLLNGQAEGDSFLITASDTSSCLPSDTLWVVVKSLPDLDVNADLKINCNGFMVNLETLGLPSAVFEWTVNGETLTETNAKVTHRLNSLDLKYFKLPFTLVRKTPTCTDTLAGELSFENPFESSFPNIFTPNGDGINDCLYPPKILSLNCAQFSVFSRSGQKMWDNKNGNCWDGNYQEQPAPEGVYFYLFKLGTFQFNGFVHLAR